MAGQYASEFYVAFCVLGSCTRHSSLFVAGQYPSDFHVACCVVVICKTS